MNEQVKEVIHKVLNNYGYKTKYGWEYTFPIAMDDKIDTCLVMEAIAEDPECPDLHLEQWVYEAYDDAWLYVLHEVFKDIETECTKNDINIENMYDDIQYYVHDNFYLNLEMEDRLKQSVCVNIVMDTGTGNYEFETNRLTDFIGDEAQPYEVDNPCDLLWLANQQGYNDEQFKYALKHKTDSKFMESLKEEVLNCSSYLNSLTFCVRLSIANLFDIVKAIHKEEHLNNSYYYDKRKGNGYIIIPAKGIGYKNKPVPTTCGLVNYWNGSGSLLDVELEQDVVLPIRAIWKVFADKACSAGYPIKDIYGLSDDAWTECSVKVVEHDENKQQEELL